MIYKWHAVAGTGFSTLEEGRMVSALAGEKQLTLLRKGDMLYAFAATCPHSGALLCEGWLDVQGRVVCPLHKYRFDPANGRNTSGEGYKLKTFPVEIRDDEIFIGLLA
ncbi:Rieske (2Fe-2S) protein [Chitinophagaceae bacterium MMS25-I14]